MTPLDLDSVLSTLPTCEPESLNQLDRVIIRLCFYGAFKASSLLGAWVVDQDHFCLVVRRLDGTSLGYVCRVRQDADGAIDPDVSKMLRDIRGGTVPKAGRNRNSIGWNVEPEESLVVPWKQDPPGPNSARVFPDRPEPVWKKSPRLLVKVNLLPKAFDRLEGDMWATTLLINLLSSRILSPPGPALRLAACWAVSPDALAVIYAHVVPVSTYSLAEAGDTHLELLQRHLIRDQKYLRLGRYFAPPEVVEEQAIPYSADALDNMQASIQEYENAFYPESLLRDSVEVGGVLWLGATPERVDPGTMTAVYSRLASALDG